MWYVIQTETGREEEILRLMRRSLDKKLCSRYMILKAEWPKRSGGQWALLRKVMFPGYIFLVTEQVDILFAKLKQIPNLTKILGDGTEFIPLTQEEVGFLKNMVNEAYIAEMSKGYIIGDVVTVISGPMKEMKGKIKFIDRHKRLAVIEIEMFGRKTEVRLGLEIVKKFSADAKLLEDNYAKDTI